MSKSLLFWIILGLVAAGAIVYVAVGMNGNNGQIVPPVEDGGGNGDDDQVFCTQDAKMCSDGSFVGRVPPTCEFAPCPGGQPAPEPIPDPIPVPPDRY